MERHSALKALARDHHHALVLARQLTGRSKGAALRGDAAEGAAGVRETWDRELRPHFLLEERELVPLGLCHPDLAAGAQRVLADHAELRGWFEGLDTESFESRRVEMGERLEAHVRFEDRQWFGSLESLLGAATLDALTWRALPEPEAVIAAFLQDDAGVWVAELDCGHRQHVRHEPPFQQAPWVLTPTGRRQHVGSRMRCPLCRMPRLPSCARVYKETPVYDADSVPRGLLRSHRTRAGTWGRIDVLAGRVQYVLEDEHDLELTLRPGIAGIVGPARPHHVRLVAGARMKVSFLRCEGGAPQRPPAAP